MHESRRIAGTGAPAVALLVATVAPIACTGTSTLAGADALCRSSCDRQAKCALIPATAETCDAACRGTYLHVCHDEWTALLRCVAAARCEALRAGHGCEVAQIRMAACSEKTLGAEERRTLARLDETIGDLERLPRAHDLAELPAEITARVNVDQLARHAAAGAASDAGLITAIAARVRRVDAHNTARLREVIDHWSWPERSAIGDAAAEGLWLLAQHADADPELQRSALAAMEALLPSSEVKRPNLAFLRDRVARHTGAPQRYGTQGSCVGAGRWEPDTLADPARVDEERRSMELPPLQVPRRNGAAWCR
jgi:Family of unknown function (DUF6624)